MAAKPNHNFLYIKTAYDGDRNSAPSVSNWLRSNKIKATASKNTILISWTARTVNEVRLFDEIEIQSGGRRTKMGFVTLGKVSIQPKYTFAGNAGKDNEAYLIMTINRYAKHYANGKPFDIYFEDGKTSLKVNDATGAQDVSGTSSSGEKADVLITTKNGRDVGISLKKDNATFISVASSEHHDLAAKALMYAAATGKVSFDEIKDPVKRLTKSLTLELHDSEKKAYIFGKDLQGGGVVTTTFTHKSFLVAADGSLVIHCNKLWVSMKDITFPLYLNLRNKSNSKPPNPMIRGLVADIVLGTPATTIKIDREEFS